MVYSVLIRSLLALLVVLPPGTFRVLQTAIRPNELRVASSVGDSDHPLAGELDSSRLQLCWSMAPLRPEYPTRFRSWSDVTFITKDTLAVPDVSVSTGDNDTILPEQSGFLPGSVASRGAPALQSHRSPREAMLAICVLQI